MRLFTQTLAALAICLVIATKAQEQGPSSSLEQQVVSLVNKERAANKLPTLQVDAQLMLAARNHSSNMARQNTGVHVLDGKGPADRLREVGYRARFWGENIAWGARTPQQVMTGWMQSPPHRANILSPNFESIGMAVAYSSNGVPYWTQVFGRR